MLSLRPKLVTFDCANTLLAVTWRLGDFALECARHVGLPLEDSAGAAYKRLYAEKHAEYLDLNLTRDPQRCAGFWTELTRDWLTELGHDPDLWEPRIDQASQKLGFGPESTIFRVFEDVRPCLDRLDELGVRKAIISNWDFSLHHILRSLGLYDRFELVVASLEEGVEKPDPRIFHMTLEKLGVSPDEAAHVGDDAIDDLKGARDAGLRAVLIDRSRRESPTPPYIASLVELPEALGWSA